MGKTIHNRRMRISGGGGGGCLTRFVATTLIVAAVLLVTGLFLVRTEGARSLIEGQLSKRIGADVRIAQARIGWPYDLVLKNLTNRPVDGVGKAGFAAHEVRIGLGLRTRWRVAVSRFEIDLVRGSDTSWRPVCLASLGVVPWEDAAGISGVTEEVRDRVRLSLSNGTIRWHDEKERLVASAQSFRFEMAPVRVLDRRIYYYYLDIYNWLAPDGVRVHDTEREWLATGMSDYVELHTSQSADGTAVQRVEGEADDQQTTSE